MVTQHMEKGIWHGLSVSLMKRKIQKYQRKLGHGHDAELHHTVADLYHHLGENALAFESYQAAAASLLQLGRELSVPESDRLILIAKHILRLAPENAGAIQTLNREYLRRGFTYRAIELHTTLADRCARQGEYHKAIQHYQRVFAIEPNSITARLTCAMLHCQLGEYRQAAKAYAHIGDLYFEHHRFDGALAYYQQAGQLAPEEHTVQQKIILTQRILDGTLHAQTPVAPPAFTQVNEERTQLQQALAEKDRIEEELRRNMTLLQQRYQDAVAQKNAELQNTQQQFEELGTELAVLKAHLEHVDGEKERAQAQLTQELAHQQALEGKLAKLNTLELAQADLPQPNAAGEAAARVQSAIIRLDEERARLEEHLQKKIQESAARETQLRGQVAEQTAQATALEEHVRQLTAECQAVEQQMQAQLHASRQRERRVQAEMRELLDQHEQALKQIEKEKQELAQKYRNTQQRMNLAEKRNVTALAQIHGELTRQCDQEHDLFEKFHQSVSEIALLLYDQEQEIQKLEQL